MGAVGRNVGSVTLGEDIWLSPVYTKYNFPVCVHILKIKSSWGIIIQKHGVWFKIKAAET